MNIKNIDNYKIFKFTDENSNKIKHVIEKYPKEQKSSAVMPLLDLAMRQCNGWVPESAMKVIASLLEMPFIRVYEVATFYSMFNLEPVGKYFIQICTTTPCWLRGSDKIVEACERNLKIKSGKTTSDGMFTIKQVECLGACVNAPMMQINDDYYEDLDKEKTIEIFEKILKGETPKPGSYRGRLNTEPENNRKTLMDFKNA